jgi:hypothetical protein
MKKDPPKHESDGKPDRVVPDWKERLRKLGIGPDHRLHHLTVAPGATVELRHDHPYFKHCFLDIPIRDLDHFVDLCGPGLRLQPRPDQARQETLSHLPEHLRVRRVPEKYRRVTELVGRALIGEQVEWKDDDIALGNQWVSERKQVVLALADIYVHTRARLVLGTNVLVARYVTVERFGQIVIPAASHTKIDCAGMEGSKFVVAAAASTYKFSLTPFVP